MILGPVGCRADSASFIKLPAYTLNLARLHYDGFHPLLNLCQQLLGLHDIRIVLSPIGQIRKRVSQCPMNGKIEGARRTDDCNAIFRQAP